MTTLTAHRLRLLCQADAALTLPAVHGPAIRGAFIGALLSDFCPAGGGAGCGAPELASACPICGLLANVEEGVGHGVAAPRPFTVEPVRGSQGTYDAGAPFEFGLTLFGESVGLFPYILAAISHMGRRGMGERQSAPGRFRLQEAWAVNPPGGIQHRVMSELEDTLTMPDLTITHEMVLQRAAQLPCDAIEIDVHTPLRLVTEGTLVRRLTFEALMRRLLRRLDQLALVTTSQGLDIPFSDLIDASRGVRVLRDETRWLDATSFSSRTKRSTPIGGLIGRISFAGELAPFLPWLVWGEITHVGKDATKGNGWYHLTRVTSV